LASQQRDKQHDDQELSKSTPMNRYWLENTTRTQVFSCA